ncbi:unnamed protein product [Trifolium pratense]|uniref:Uncharacterized protein n=1 Tax=Trifolium pratense TaxID=57577 RepID=A0ACB0J7B3_TRIPR|nr:unnamed protein product [Trifolium pratense]
MDMVRCMLKAKQIPKEFWAEAVATAVYILNRCPRKSVREKTPEEAWSGRRPSIRHLRVFGCIAYAHVPDQLRKKLDDKGERCIFFGYSPNSKAYKLYNPETKKVIISRDVTFDEGGMWNWSSKSQKEPVVTSNDFEEENEQETEHVDPTPDEPETSNRLQRQRRLLARLQDCVLGNDNDPSDEEIINFALFADCEPLNFEEASGDENWIKAMDEEINAIEKNKTWELTELPANKRPIGVKWVYKTKYKPSGEIDRFKARLVAKGYKQKPEEVYVEQPAGYVVQGKEDKVYRLKKALYGLKQAPRAWYKKIDSYFLQNGFQRCPFEHTLYIKFIDPGDVLIVCLYVDDLIFTGNNSKMIAEFREAMIRRFEMTDLGLMSYFLCIEVVQQNDGIFISQKKYATNILKKFKMEHSKPISTPVEEKLKLTRKNDGKRVDSTYYKSLIGSLRYLTATRPDIVYGVGLLSRYMEEPRVSHLQGAKRILRYIKGTLTEGIFYGSNSDVKLVGYTDSDWAGDLETRKSTSGYAFHLGTGAISWSSKKQPVVALSTAEAEYIAATSCATQTVWLSAREHCLT